MMADAIQLRWSGSGGSELEISRKNSSPWLLADWSIPSEFSHEKLEIQCSNWLLSSQ
jgi:hypothetical protein